MSVLSDEERAHGLTPSPIDALVEEVKRLRAENAEQRRLLQGVADAKDGWWTAVDDYLYQLQQQRDHPSHGQPTNEG